MIGQTIAHYQVLRKIGRGGQGEAYLALDTKLGRPVVIKFLPLDQLGDEQARARFLKEARLASQLDHPNICTIHEVNEADGRLFIVMQYVEGMTLKDLINHKPLPIQTALTIAMQIAEALTEAHERGIIHRDIKSSNIIITDKGRAVLLDFGLAAREQKVQSHSRLPTFKCASPFGTPSYMSPEQVQGRETDARTDVFSFGVVLYEMITGQRPFAGKSVEEIMKAIAEDEPLPPHQITTNIDRDLEGIILRALRKDPEERYDSMASLRNDLSLVATRLGMTDGSGVRALLVEATKKERQVKRLLLISILSLLVVAVLFVLSTLVYNKLVTTNQEPTSATTTPRTVAILPFRNLKNDHSSDFIGYALADSIINNLAYVRRLVVRPPTSVEKYRNQTIDVNQVGKELRVDTVLSGSFIKEDQEIRVNTQLIDLTSNSVLWTDVMNVRADNLLSLQDTIAKRIVSELQIHLSTEEEERLGKDVSRNPAAYEYFMMSKGLELVTDQTKRAVELLQKSIQLDPAYSPAWVELGWRFRHMSLFGLGSREFYDQAEQAAEQALRLNPDQVYALALLAHIYTDEGRLEEALNLLRRGLEISPNRAELYEGLRYAYRYAGLLDQSLAAYEKVMQLDPRFQERPTNFIQHGFLYIGDYERFIETVADREAPVCYFFRGLARFYLQDKPRALAELEHAIELDPKNSFSLLSAALKAKIEDKTDQGLNVLRDLEAKREQGGIPDGEMSYKLAQLYAQLGDVKSSLRMLRKSIEQGFFCFPYISQDPLVEPIRSSGEYQSLIAAVKQKHEELKRKFGQKKVT